MWFFGQVRHGAGRWTTVSSVDVRQEEILLLHLCPDWSWTPRGPLTDGYWCPFSRGLAISAQSSAMSSADGLEIPEL